MTDEATLLKRIQAHDVNAVAQIYDKYHERIFRYLYWRLGQVEIAEDVAANVFLNLLNAVRDGHCPQTNLSGWLYRVAHNLAVDTLRGMPEEERELAEWLEDDEPDVMQVVEHQLQMDHVRSALQQLTETQQQVIVLRFLEGMTSREVAEIMGSSEGSVEALQHRAIASLRRVLQQGRSPEGT